MRNFNEKPTLFSERLKELRKSANLSQAKLATKVGFNRSTISDWETRDKEPSFKTLCELARIFDVSTDYLLGYNESNN